VNTATKLAAFAAAVAATFGGAMVVGAAVGPLDVSDGTSQDSHRADRAIAPPRGLAVAEAGYRLAVESTAFTANSASEFEFEVVDESGTPVTDFEALHERPLHLIVLSRNLVDYLHLHPAIDATGRWTVDLPALDPGSYRVFADFQPAGGDNLTLGTDVEVAGDVERVALAEPSTIGTVDGYRVTLDGEPRVGDSELSFTVEHAGARVRTEQYLGAAGHLVAIRSGDLAYLHVHPHEDGTSPVVTFTGEFPTAGTYRLFFDFAHGGVVRTAAFTVVVPDADEPHGDRTESTTSHDEGH
jgi:hypothetical protein